MEWDPAAVEERIQRNLGRGMFAARWIMAPIYIGLLVALVMVVMKFVQKLVQAIPGLLALSSNEAIFLVLTLVDLSLVANLVVIVIFAGWENFVGRLLASHAERPARLARRDRLRHRQAASDRFDRGDRRDPDPGDLRAYRRSESQDAAWQLAILLGIGVVGVLLALADRLERRHTGESNQMQVGIQFFPDIGPDVKSARDYWQEALSLVASVRPLRLQPCPHGRALLPSLWRLQPEPRGVPRRRGAAHANARGWSPARCCRHSTIR